MNFFYLMFSLCTLSSAAGVFPTFSFDRWCDSCSQRVNDSLFARQETGFEVNQLGFHPEQVTKEAFVRRPAEMTFELIDSTGSVAFSGTLEEAFALKSGAREVFGKNAGVTELYQYKSLAQGDSLRYRADFSDFKTPGVYKIRVGAKESFPFEIRENLDADLLQLTLLGLNAQRSGENHSLFHKPSHLKDGNYLGEEFEGALAGGWYDCGDNLKVHFTISYTSLSLVMAYLNTGFALDRVNQRGEEIPDQVPDLLNEAKVGVDYLVKLFKVSKEAGLWDTGTFIYGTQGDSDHNYWGPSEFQELLPQAMGGSPRIFGEANQSSDLLAIAAPIAWMANAVEAFDPALAGEYFQVAQELYDVGLAKTLAGEPNVAPYGSFYSADVKLYDALAMAGMALWKFSGEEKYKYDLFENAVLGDNSTMSSFDKTLFPRGVFAQRTALHAGGWVSDFSNWGDLTAYTLWKQFLERTETITAFGLDSVAVDYNERLLAILESQNVNLGIVDGVEKDRYGLLWTQLNWGMNRYNMGALYNTGVLSKLKKESTGLETIQRNFDYLFGKNPWESSLVHGVGSKQIPKIYDRRTNPENRNIPLSYSHQRPLGLLSGGVLLTDTLAVGSESWVQEETCIDYSASWLLAQSLLWEEAALPPKRDSLESSAPRTVVFQLEEDGRLFLNWNTQYPTRSVAQVRIQGSEVWRSLDQGLAVGQVHQVEVIGLVGGETIEARIAVGDSYDDNAGAFYTFTYPVQKKNFKVEISRTNKGNGTPHQYLRITNLNGAAESDIEARLYLDGETQDTLTINSFDNQLFASNGIAGMLSPVISIGWDAEREKSYVSVSGLSFSVGSQAVIELQWNTTTWGRVNEDVLDSSWSLGTHEEPFFPGWKSTPLAASSEEVNGGFEFTYQENPYVALFQGGQHIGGIAPQIADEVVKNQTLQSTPMDLKKGREEFQVFDLQGKRILHWTQSLPELKSHLKAKGFSQTLVIVSRGSVRYFKN